jgi:hypothetical protein
MRLLNWLVLGGTLWASAALAGLAPDPATTPEPVIQVYAARAMGAKGWFGVHTWVAVKPRDARQWTVHEVIGWRLRWSDSAVVTRHRQPDAPWFGAQTELLADVRGEGVDELITRVEQAVHAYPFGGEYTLWPGPNSNTFTAWIARAVPELEIDLPPTAIGKDYLRDKVFASAPSGSGFQFSLGGLLGVTASSVEGFELNVLGLHFGVNPFAPSIRLPIVGRIGAPTDVRSPALRPKPGGPPEPES